jgi:hypothetical protein
VLINRNFGPVKAASICFLNRTHDAKIFENIAFLNHKTPVRSYPLFQCKSLFRLDHPPILLIKLMKRPIPITLTFQIRQFIQYYGFIIVQHLMERHQKVWFPLHQPLFPQQTTLPGHETGGGGPDINPILHFYELFLVDFGLESPHHHWRAC